jgi:DNA primase
MGGLPTPPCTLHDAVCVRIDVENLKARNNLLETIGGQTPLRKIATTDGGEYAGPCPFCGGNDRFHVQPAQGRWFCRLCTDGRWQDVIAYVQQRDGVGFQEACRRLGADADGRARHYIAGSPPRSDRARWVPKNVHPPPTPWQAAGMRLVEECERALWSNAGEKARSYLHDRGLSEQTLRFWHVGYQPQRRRLMAADTWGMADDVWVPCGVVLPCVANGALWHLKVRDLEPTGSDQRYRAVRGGQPYLFGADNLRRPQIPVLVEGEFDAMLLHQEAGDIVSAATLGSASARLTLRAGCALLRHPLILLAYDSDGSSDRGIAAMQAMSARIRNIIVPRTGKGKDLTDFVKSGGDLRAWISGEVSRVVTTVRSKAV